MLHSITEKITLITFLNNLMVSLDYFIWGMGIIIFAFIVILGIWRTAKIQGLQGTDEEMAKFKHKIYTGQ